MKDVAQHMENDIKARMEKADESVASEGHTPP
jgi:hypothetical protein